jgi:hypothetical protein
LIVSERAVFVGDVALVAVERLHEASEHVVQGNVVIARHHDLRAGQGVEEGARLLELLALRTLGQVAGNDDDVRRDRMDQVAQRSQQCLVDTSEMQVGQVDDCSHGFLVDQYSR